MISYVCFKDSTHFQEEPDFSFEMIDKSNFSNVSFMKNYAQWNRL